MNLINNIEYYYIIIIILIMLTEMSDGIIENKMVTEIPPPLLEINQDQYITYTYYEKNPNCINKMNLSNLREMLKFYKNSMVIPATYSSKMKKEAKNAIKTVHDFALIGTKKVFLERINKYFIQETNASKIQRIIREILRIHIIEVIWTTLYPKYIN